MIRPEPPVLSVALICLKQRAVGYVQLMLAVPQVIFVIMNQIFHDGLILNSLSRFCSSPFFTKLVSVIISVSVSGLHEVIPLTKTCLGSSLPKIMLHTPDADRSAFR